MGVVTYTSWVLAIATRVDAAVVATDVVETAVVAAVDEVTMTATTAPTTITPPTIAATAIVSTSVFFLAEVIPVLMEEVSSPETEITGLCH